MIAYTLFLLSQALQTGLTSLEPEKRFARLCKNLCLLVTALFHFIHNMARSVKDVMSLQFRIVFYDKKILINY